MAPAESPSGGRSARLIIGAAAVALLLIVGAFAAGRLTAPVVSAPSDTSTEAGFARDMQVHHNQAVEMSLLVRDLTTDADVRLLAYDIASTQAQQSGQMYGWLALWGLPQTESEPSMTWMTRPPITGGATHGHDGAGSGAHTPGDPMPGLATFDQLNALRQLSGVDAEREYLTLMIAHHEGGVEMAEAALDRSTERVVRSLASGIVTSQSSEIELMTSMLADRAV